MGTVLVVLKNARPEVVHGANARHDMSFALLCLPPVLQLSDLFAMIECDTGRCRKNSSGLGRPCFLCRHAAWRSKFKASSATASVKAFGPMPKARSTMRASSRMSPARLKIAA